MWFSVWKRVRVRTTDPAVADDADPAPPRHSPSARPSQTFLVLSIAVESATLTLNNGWSHGGDARRARPIELREYPYPERLEPGAVLVRMLASGICGTDKHTFRGETEQYAGTDTRGRRRFPSSRDTRTSASSRIGPGRPAPGTARSSQRRPRRAAPNRPCGSCRFCTGDFPYYLCERIENYGNSTAPSRRTSSAAGAALPAAGHADLPGARRAAHRRRRLTELMSVTHSLDLAVRLPRRRAGAATRSRSSASSPRARPRGQGHAARRRARRGDRPAPVAPRARPGARRRRGGRPGGGGRLDADVVVDQRAPGLVPARARASPDGGTLVEVGAFVALGTSRSTPRCCAAAT